MRFFFLLVLLAGGALGVGYPWYVNNFSGEEIGAWPAYDRAAGFRTFEVKLIETQAPVRVLVDLTTLGAPTFDDTRTVLTITAAGGGRTVLADTLTFRNAVRREVSPQATEKIYRADAGVIHAVAAGTYTFTLGRGDAEGIDMRSVDVVLRSDSALLDPRAQPLGFTLLAVGFIGLVAASRRRRREAPPSNPNSQPPPPRWGRDAGKR